MVGTATVPPAGPAMTNRAFSLPTETTRGFAVALAAAASISLFNVLTPVVYALGSNAATLLVLRFVCLVPVCALWLWLQSVPFALTPRALMHCIGAGFAFTLGAGALITAFGLMPISLVILIFYTYPLVTRLAECALDRRRPDLFEIACLLAALVGLALCLGVGFEQLHGPGVVASMIAALAITGSFLWTGRKLKTVPPTLQTLYMAGTGLILTTLFIVATASWATPPLRSVGTALMAAAVISSVAAFLGMFISVRMIGPSRAAMVMNLEPMLTIVLAILLLEEALTTHHFLGAALVIAAVVAAQAAPRRAMRTAVD